MEDQGRRRPGQGRTAGRRGAEPRAVEGERSRGASQERSGQAGAGRGRLRRETTLTICEIAKRLHIGSRKSLNNKLYLGAKAREKGPKVTN
jgi:hypothetical protein